MDPQTTPAIGDRLIHPPEAARLLGVSPGTLAVWRCTKRYPLPYIKIGRKVMYRREDIERFVSANLRLSEGGA